MSDKHSHINHNVDAELIRKYLAGELDNKAMHALEKQALDDPFLADALDGFAEHKPDQRMNLSDLHKRLELRTQGQGNAGNKGGQGRVFRMDTRWLAAAAVGAVIVAVLVWMWQDGTKDPSLALKETSVADSAITDTLQYYNQEEPSGLVYKSTVENKPGIHISSDSISNIPTIIQAPSAESKQLADAVEKIQHRNDSVALAVAPTPVAVAAAAPTLMDDRQHQYAMDSVTTKIIDIAGVTKMKEPEIPVTTGRNVTYASAGAAPAKYTGPMRTIQGRVIDGESVLSGVTVKVEGTSNGVLTDAQGRFSLSVPDTMQDLNLMATMVGYDSRKLKVRNRQNNLKIILEPNANALSDMLITGSDKTNYTKNKKGYYQAPLPAEGYDSYRQYLSKNTKYPASAAAAGVKGKVKVSFRVSPDGALDDIRITRRLQPDCDAEALRVIKEGPGWTPASDGTATRVQIEVEFPPK